MIEGLKIDITCSELKVHLEERAEYHRKKTEWYAKQVSSLREGGADSTHMSNDPVSSLAGSAKSHKERASYFAFLAKHLVADEVYRLSESDLGEIELASRYYPGLGRLR
jgi:hypothetical protein